MYLIIWLLLLGRELMVQEGIFILSKRRSDLISVKKLMKRKIYVLAKGGPKEWVCSSHSCRGMQLMLCISKG